MFRWLAISADVGSYAANDQYHERQTFVEWIEAYMLRVAQTHLFSLQLSFCHGSCPCTLKVSRLVVLIPEDFELWMLAHLSAASIVRARMVL